MEKTRLLFIAIVLFWASASYAQETISINVIYEFKYVRDTARRDHPYTASMILSLGKQSSRYCAEKLYLENDKNAAKKRAAQQERQQVSSGRTTIVSGGPMLIVNKYGAIINEEIIKNSNDKTLILNSEMGFKSYRVESTLSKIDWKVKEDKKMIDKYSCQKAIGVYAGRTYEAWFTPDLSYQEGPWKLSGLPGLILEARDLKNEVSFTFKSLNKNTDPEETTKSFLQSDFSIKTNLKAYNRAKAAFETDPESVMAAMAPNAVLAVHNIDDPNAGHALKIKKYNPLELE